MAKLTKRQIEALEPREKDYFVWDPELSGFGIRVFPTGRKQFVVQYRYGRVFRRLSLGRFGAITPDQARGLALEALVKLRNDIDPLAEKRARRDALLVKELADRFDHEHIAVHLKASTAKEYRRNLKLFILPAIGHLRIINVTRADISKYHHIGVTVRTRPIAISRSSPRCSISPNFGALGTQSRLSASDPVKSVPAERLNHFMGLGVGGGAVSLVTTCL